VAKVCLGDVDEQGRPRLLSRAVKARGLIYTAGITARDAAGTVPAGIAAQTENILDRLRSILAEAGATLDDVVKVSIYVVSLDGLATMNEVYRRFFPRRAPARAMVQVAGLADPEYLIEIEMVAVEPGGD